MLAPLPSREHSSGVLCGTGCGPRHNCISIQFLFALSPPSLPCTMLFHHSSRWTSYSSISESDSTEPNLSQTERTYKESLCLQKIQTHTEIKYMLDTRTGVSYGRKKWSKRDKKTSAEMICLCFLSKCY